MHCLEIECVGHVNFRAQSIVCVLVKMTVIFSCLVAYSESISHQLYIALPPFCCMTLLSIPFRRVRAGVLACCHPRMCMPCHATPLLWYCASSNYRGINIAVRLAHRAVYMYDLCCKKSILIWPTYPIDIVCK